MAMGGQQLRIDGGRLVKLTAFTLYKTFNPKIPNKIPFTGNKTIQKLTSVYHNA